MRMKSNRFTDVSIRQALAQRILNRILEILQQEPVFFGVDDTTIAKWGRHEHLNLRCSSNGD